MNRNNLLRQRTLKYALERIYLAEKAYEPKKGDTMTCPICKRKAHLLNNGKGPLVCCGKPMVKSTLPVTEGLIDKIKCKAAKHSYKENKAIMDHAKEGLKNCHKQKSPLRPENCKRHFEARIRITTKPLERATAAVKKNCKQGVSEAGFEDKPKGWTDQSIKKYSKTFTKQMKGAVTSKDFFDKCVKKMQGKMENPEGFCASLKDEAHGSTYWRGKGKTPGEVKKDVSAHKNV